MRPEDRLCAGVTAAQGRICRAPVVQVVADVPLCRSHLQKITDALAGAPRVVTSAVVYYLGDPDVRQVKIGSTTRLSTRFDMIRRERPAVVLLAAEPGHRDLERQRHRQWVNSRVSHRGGNREWYHKNDALMAWVNDVRRTYGDPWDLPGVQASR